MKKPVGRVDTPTTNYEPTEEGKAHGKAPAAEQHVPQPPSNNRRRPPLHQGGSERTYQKKDDDKRRNIE